MLYLPKEEWSAFGTWIINNIRKGNWRMKPLPDVDPFKTVMTIEKAAELGLTDLDTESTARNGSIGKSNRTKLTRQIEELPTDPFGVKELEAEIMNNDDNNEEEDE